MRQVVLLAGALLLTAAAGFAQVEELFSRFIQVFQPQGAFSRVLTAANPAPDSWPETGDEGLTFRIRVPADAAVDRKPAGSRVLQVRFAGTGATRAVLRIDRFKPAPGEPTSVDTEYVEAVVAEYPEHAFGGKFQVTDSGLAVLGKKTRFAMVGGTFQRGAVEMNRLQWTYLSKGQQFFVTFDCAAADWEMHAPTLARALLTLDLAGAR